MFDEDKTRDSNIMGQTSMQESAQEASLAPELSNLSEAERSGDKAAETDALNGARNEVARKISMAKAELAEVRATAERRGEPPPQISANLDMDTSTMDARDLAQAEQSVSQAQQSINGAQGSQMLQSVGDAVAGLAAFGLVLNEVREGNLGNLTYNANLPGQQEKQSIAALLS